IYGSRAESTSVLAGGAISVGGGAVNIAGNATIAGIRYSFPLMKSPSNTHSLSLGVDYKHLRKTEAAFPSDLGTAVVLSPISYLPASLSYSGLLTHHSGLTRITGTAKGYVAGTIPGGSEEDFTGNGTPEDPGQRVGSTGTFAVLQGALERVQLLPL